MLTPAAQLQRHGWSVAEQHTQAVEEEHHGQRVAG